MALNNASHAYLSNLIFVFDKSTLQSIIPTNQMFFISQMIPYFLLCQVLHQMFYFIATPTSIYDSFTLPVFTHVERSHPFTSLI